MNKLIGNSLARRKVQTVSILVVVAASVTLLFALLLVYSGVSRGVALSEERGGAEVMVLPADAAESIDTSKLLFTGTPAAIYMKSDVADRVAAVDGVRRTSVQFFSQTLDASCCAVGSTAETRVVGYDSSTDWVIAPLVEEAGVSSLADDEVLLGAELPGNPDGTVTIRDDVYRVAGHLAKTSSDIDYSIITNIGVARDMAKNLDGYDHTWEEYGDPDTLVSTVLVDLDPTLSSQDRQMTLRKIGNLDGVSVVERSTVIDDSEEQLQSIFGLMLGLGVVMLVVSVLQLFSRFYTMAWDRKSELALYRAVGASRRQISRLIAGEAFVLSAAGVVVGLVLGFLLSLGGASYLQSTSAFPYVAPSAPVVAVGVLVVLVVFALVTLLSIVAPLRQIGRIDPSLAMRQSDIG